MRAPTTAPSVLFFGDSYTKFQTETFADTMDARWDLNNFGVSGSTSATTLAVIQAQLPNFPSTCAVHLQNANDLLVTTFVAADRVADALANVDEVLANGNPLVYSLNPPIYENAPGGITPATQSSRRTAYNALLEPELVTRGVPYLDWWSWFEGLADWRALYEDGIHMNERGYARIMPFIKRELVAVLGLA